MQSAVTFSNTPREDRSLGLQIFVEDRLTDTYEVLALRALKLPTSPRNRQRVRASRIEPADLTTRDNLLDLVRRSVASGYGCVMFIIDQEASLRSPERTALLALFRDAFSALCSYQKRLRSGDSLRRARIIRVVCQRCLEGWLAADLHAVVDSVRGGLGIDYRPPLQNSADLLPLQAGQRIVSVIREVGRRIERKDLRRVNLSTVKSRGPAIAEFLEPERARRFNDSLDYFLKMVDCQRSGCEHPFPG
jgi:hypothetical protein